jgi:hypothetical protein
MRLNSFAIAGAVALIFAATMTANAQARAPSLAPPTIASTITCTSAFEWTLGLNIRGDREIAYFMLQPKGTFGLTATMVTPPGQKTVQWSLPGNGAGRTLLILAADVSGASTKAIVDVPETYCGAQPTAPR